MSSDLPSAGEEFRQDLRTDGAVGSGNAAARRWLTPAELAPLTTLHNGRSALAVGQTLLITATAIAAGVWLWPSPWVALCVIVIGVQQHAWFILAHESAHYRLFSLRGLNDGVGRAIGMASGISMCTYRVIHRLHHNHLYGPQDPDTAIHGGYPRGVRYLWKKLAQDLVGWNAWKTLAYFFGAPAIADEQGAAQRSGQLLNDTSPSLRRTARQDRWAVLAFQLLFPVALALLWGGRALWMYLVLWPLPILTVLQPILRLRAVCEHGAVTDLRSPLTAARTNRTWGRVGNRLGRLLFPHHVNYHLEHHLYPAVPHYHLPALHRLLAAKGALQGAEVRDLQDTLGQVFAPRPPRQATAAALTAKP
jgi:fatty acid desaturase